VNRGAVSHLGGIAGSVLLIRLYANIDSPWCWLGWVVLVPWLAALNHTRSLSGALLGALAMDIAYVLVNVGWFAETVRIYTGVSAPVALLSLLLLAPVLEPQFFAFAAARHLLRRSDLAVARGGRGLCYAVLGAACAYVAAEWAFPRLFGETLGHGLYGSRWMRQGADVAGGAGLTFLVVIANECALAAGVALAGGGAWADRLRRAALPAALFAAVPAALLAYGFIRCRQLDAAAAAAPKVKIAAVQANISNYEKIEQELGTYEGTRFILDAHYRLTTQTVASSNPDLVVWPETVYPTTFGAPKSPDGAAFDREIGGFVAASGRPFIFGSYDAEGGRQYNAAVFIAADRDGKIGYEAYRKALLFPLTEWVPAWLDRPWLRQRLPWLGTWTAGEPPAAVPVELAGGRSMRVAPLICYDALDPELARGAARRGAELIVTLSNDSWFSAGLAPRLHLVMAAFRSVENHLPQVRATNTGISAMITAAGDITASLGSGERGVLVAEVAPVRAADTLAVRWGNWLPPVALLAALALVGASLLAPTADRHGRQRARRRPKRA